VLLAEFMLRRTRAEQVVPVYRKLGHLGRSPRALSEAGAKYSASILRPLGLRWRATQLHDLATALEELHGGKVPQERTELLALPGVGDYVAAAVRSLAFNLPDVLVDTNTVRVASRVFGFAYGPESRRRRDIREAVALLHSPARPRESAQALLDFGALVCTARAPHCSECPVSEICVFFTDQTRRTRESRAALGFALDPLPAALAPDRISARSRGAGRRGTQSHHRSDDR
jgi:A/G-specific adenine glycosylase